MERKSSKRFNSRLFKFQNLHILSIVSRFYLAESLEHRRDLVIRTDGFLGRILYP